MGCQVCQLQQQNELNATHFEFSSRLKQSITQEPPNQITLHNMEIQSFPHQQFETKLIQAPSIELERNEEFILDHTSSQHSLNQLTTLKQIISVMTGQGNLDVEIHNKKPHTNTKQKKKRVTMKDLEKQF